MWIFKSLKYLPAFERDFWRQLGDGEDLSHPGQQEVRGEVHRVRGEPRPGAGGGQDAGLLADGQGDVHPHVYHVPAQPHHRPRHGPPQDDQADHNGAGGRGLSEFYW